MALPGSELPVIYWTYFIGVIIILGCIVFVAAWKIREKLIYKYKVRLNKLRENGAFLKEYNYIGGVIRTHDGKKDFQVKLGKWPWQKKRLGYIPDPNATYANETVEFVQIGDGEIWQQLTRTFITKMEKEIGTEGEKVIVDLLVHPIPSQHKTLVINELQRAHKLFNTDKLAAGGILLIGFIIMVLGHLVWTWITHKGA